MVVSNVTSTLNVTTAVNATSPTVVTTPQTTIAGKHCPVIKNASYKPKFINIRNYYALRISTNETRPGTFVHLLCNDGLVLQPNSRYVKCQTDGTWDWNKQPTCVVKRADTTTSNAPTDQLSTTSIAVMAATSVIACVILAMLIALIIVAKRPKKAKTSNGESTGDQTGPSIDPDNNSKVATSKDSHDGPPRAGFPNPPRYTPPVYSTAHDTRLTRDERPRPPPNSRNLQDYHAQCYEERNHLPYTSYRPSHELRRMYDSDIDIDRAPRFDVSRKGDERQSYSDSESLRRSYSAGHGDTVIYQPMTSRSQDGGNNQLWRQMMWDMPQSSTAMSRNPSYRL